MSIESDNYAQGYNFAKANPASAAQDLAWGNRLPSYLAGERDALAGKPMSFTQGRSGTQAPAATQTPPATQAPAAARTTVGGVFVEAPNSGGQPPKTSVDPRYPVTQAPEYNHNLPPGPAQFALGNARFYEVLARSLLGKMPYDYAVGVERQAGQSVLLTLLKTAITFDVLGADPNDWNQGYRLSGPNGAIAQRVYRLISTGVLRGTQADPKFYGLDGWYGAKTQNGFKLLGAGELQALGLI